MVDLNAAFKDAVEQEGRVRQTAAERAQALNELPEAATVELSEPDRIQRTWRAVLATFLIAASFGILAVRFWDLGTKDSLPSDTMFLVFFVALLLAGLVLAIGWGKAKVTWGGEEKGDENGEDGS